MRNPLTPAENPIPVLLRFMRTPGKTLMLLRNLNPIFIANLKSAEISPDLDLFQFLHLFAEHNPAINPQYLTFYSAEGS